MNTERLLRLADLVETIAPEKFDLNFFWHDGCGCAIGHGTANGLFKSLKVGSSRDFITHSNGSFVDVTSAFAKEVGISKSGAYFLTISTSYITGLNDTPSPSEVAIRIRLFVEHHDEKVVRELELA